MGGKRGQKLKVRDLNGTKEKGRPEYEYQLLEEGSFIYSFFIPQTFISECSGPHL